MTLSMKASVFMKNINKPLMYSFSGILILMNTILISLEVHRLFRMNYYIETYGTSFSVSQSMVTEMEQVISIREVIRSVTTIVGLAVILFISIKYKEKIRELFYLCTGINLLFLITILIIHVITYFHYGEFIGALSPSLTVNSLMGIYCLRYYLRLKKQTLVRS